MAQKRAHGGTGAAAADDSSPFTLDSGASRRCRGIFLGLQEGVLLSDIYGEPNSVPHLPYLHPHFHPAPP